MIRTCDTRIRKLFFVMTLLIIQASFANAYEFSETDKCKASLADIFLQSPRTISLDSIKGEVHYLSYIRRDDGEHLSYKCKVKGNQIIWGADDGRWRTHESDDVITYETSSDSITINHRYPNNSVSRKVYSYNDLSPKLPVGRRANPSSPEVIWMNSLSQHFKENWTYTSDSTDLRCVIYIKLNRDGYVVGRRIGEHSGNIEFNKIAIRALANMAPFPPMPEDISYEKMEAKLVFVPLKPQS